VPPFLVNRLVQAAIFRRERLLYRERHQKKLGHGSKFADPINLDAGNTMGGQPMPHLAISEKAALLNEDNASQKPAKAADLLEELFTHCTSVSHRSFINNPPG
jgi:hypothetical protein